MLWDEVIILSIRWYERKGQLAPVEPQAAPAQGTMLRSLNPVGQRNERNRKKRQSDRIEKLTEKEWKW